MQVGQPMYTAQTPIDNPQISPQVQALIRARQAQQPGTQPVVNGVQQTLTPGQQAILNFIHQHPAAAVQQQNTALMQQYSPGVGTLAQPNITPNNVQPGTPTNQAQFNQAPTMVPGNAMNQQGVGMPPPPPAGQPMQVQNTNMGGGGLSQGGMNALARYYAR